MNTETLRDMLMNPSPEVKAESTRLAREIVAELRAETGIAPPINEERLAKWLEASRVRWESLTKCGLPEL